LADKNSSPIRFQKLRECTQSGKLKTEVATVLPLAEVKEAHQLSESERTRGEIFFTGRCIQPAIDSQGSE
jgi:NADPH:quinone reductase-like Zn-dependent oxidoreductase